MLRKEDEKISMHQPVFPERFQPVIPDNYFGHTGIVSCRQQT